jgi:hypothetical protein
MPVKAPRPHLLFHRVGLPPPIHPGQVIGFYVYDIIHNPNAEITQLGEGEGFARPDSVGGASERVGVDVERVTEEDVESRVERCPGPGHSVTLTGAGDGEREGTRADEERTGGHLDPAVASHPKSLVPPSVEELSSLPDERVDSEASIAWGSARGQFALETRCRCKRSVTLEAWARPAEWPI